MKLQKLQVNLYNRKTSLNLQKLILFKIYTEHATQRADFVEMKIVSKYKPDKMDNKYNYVDLKNELFIILNHKTEKSGKITLKINKDTLKLIKKLRTARITEDLDRETFLLRADGEPMTAHYLGIMVNRLTGCGINELRKRYASRNMTPANQEMLEQMGADARQMGHSLETHVQDYIKIKRMNNNK